MADRGPPAAFAAPAPPPADDAADDDAADEDAADEDAAAVRWLTEQRRAGRPRDPAVARRLLERRGWPTPPAVVHVVGTNGKGTVAYALAAMAQATGRRTGRFTSPHVEDVRERVAVDGRPPTRAELTRFVAAARALDVPGIGFFEWTLAWAVEVFARADVALAVVEAGVGARHDATMALDHVVGSVLTNVDLDHLETLGPTLEDIARDKAAVARPGVPLVTGARGRALEVVAAVARDVGAPLIVARGGPLTAWPAGAPSDVAGWPATRRANARLALALGRTLGWPEPALARGLAAPAPPARFERFVVVGPRGPVAVVLDGAHDPAAAARVAAAMPRGYVLLFGALARKQAGATLAPLRRRAARVVATTADPDEPSAVVAADATTIADPQAAIAHAVELAEALGAPVLVAGSLHLAGRVRPWLRAHALALAPEPAPAGPGAMLGGRWDASGSSA